MIRKFGIIVFVLFIVIQFIRPVKNHTVSSGNASIVNAVQVPQEVLDILKTYCYDCHSNHTVYPWYSNIQPVGWWLANHVKNGKKKLNFDEFMNYDPKKAAKKIQEIAEEVQAGEMPLKSYTIIHGDAILSDPQKQVLYSWVKSVKQKQIRTPEQPAGAEQEVESGE
jgi:Haem-binding domain